MWAAGIVGLGRIGRDSDVAAEFAVRLLSDRRPCAWTRRSVPLARLALLDLTHAASSIVGGFSERGPRAERSVAGLHWSSDVEGLLDLIFLIVATKKRCTCGK